MKVVNLNSSSKSLRSKSLFATLCAVMFLTASLSSSICMAASDSKSDRQSRLEEIANQEKDLQDLRRQLIHPQLYSTGAAYVEVGSGAITALLGLWGGVVALSDTPPAMEEEAARMVKRSLAGAALSGSVALGAQVTRTYIKQTEINPILQQIDQTTQDLDAARTALAAAAN
jgi:hypothetical protein